jgi:hypothetical protein
MSVADPPHENGCRRGHLCKVGVLGAGSAISVQDPPIRRHVDAVTAKDNDQNSA